MQPFRSTGVAALRKASKRDRVIELLHDRRYSSLADQEWTELLRESGVSGSYLRQILRESRRKKNILP
jgi:hypothetical protein